MRSIDSFSSEKKGCHESVKQYTVEADSSFFHPIVKKKLPASTVRLTTNKVHKESIVLF